SGPPLTRLLTPLGPIWGSTPSSATSWRGLTRSEVVEVLAQQVDEVIGVDLVERADLDVADVLAHPLDPALRVFHVGAEVELQVGVAPEAADGADPLRPVHVGGEVVFEVLPQFGEVAQDQ